MILSIRLFISRRVTRETSSHDTDNSVSLQLLDELQYMVDMTDESPSLGLVD